MEKTIIETAKQKVLNYLIDNPGEAFYGSEIIIATKLSDGSVYQSLAALEAEGYIIKNSKGRMYFYSADFDNPIVRQLKVALNVTIIKPISDKISKYSQKIILFGSASTGTNNKNSDWDLLIVSENPQKVNKILSKVSEFKLQPIIVSAAAYLEFKLKDAVFYEEVNRGIVIYERR